MTTGKPGGGIFWSSGDCKWHRQIDGEWVEVDARTFEPVARKPVRCKARPFWARGPHEFTAVDHLTVEAIAKGVRRCAYCGLCNEDAGRYGGARP